MAPWDIHQIADWIQSWGWTAVALAVCAYLLMRVFYWHWAPKFYSYLGKLGDAAEASLKTLPDLAETRIDMQRKIDERAVKVATDAAEQFMEECRLMGCPKILELVDAMKEHNNHVDIMLKEMCSYLKTFCTEARASREDTGKIIARTEHTINTFVEGVAVEIIKILKDKVAANGHKSSKASSGDKNV